MVNNVFLGFFYVNIIMLIVVGDNKYLLNM